jgi:hypothetical protein
MENYFNYEKVKQSIKTPQGRNAGILLVVLIIFMCTYWFAGLFSTPGNFRAVKPITDGQVSQYLTNYILPELNNKSQYGQPFDMVFSEQGINDIIARQVDFNSLQRSGLSDLSVAFKRNRILLTGRTVYRGFNFIVTIVLKPYINREGYLYFGAAKVEVGESRIPFVAEAIKRKIVYSLAVPSSDSNTPKFTRMLFNSGKIEPVFSLNKQKLRIKQFTVQNKQLTIQFQPE